MARFAASRPRNERVSGNEAVRAATARVRREPCPTNRSARVWRLSPASSLGDGTLHQALLRVCELGTGAVPAADLVGVTHGGRRSSPHRPCSPTRPRPRSIRPSKTRVRGERDALRDQEATRSTPPGTKARGPPSEPLPLPMASAVSFPPPRSRQAKRGCHEPVRLSRHAGRRSALPQRSS